jgi:hypothetical protein
MINILIFLLIAFQLKHFLCDFPWQTRYMLGKFKEVGWQAPLAAHAISHGLATTFILCVARMTFDLHIDTMFIVYLAIFDTIIHFIVDRCKVVFNKITGCKPTDASFWNAIGIDQMIHHLTHYGIIFAIILN